MRSNRPEARLICKIYNTLPLDLGSMMFAKPDPMQGLAQRTYLMDMTL